MPAVKGVVQKLWNKNKAWSIIIDDVFYGNGFKKPACSEGDLVKFTYKENGKFKNIDLETFEVVKGGGEGSSGVKAIAVNKDDYWKKKEERDVLNDRLRTLGASRNTAIAFVDLLLKNNAIPLPKATKDVASVIEEAVDQYQQKFMFADMGTDDNNNEEDVGDADDLDNDVEFE